MKNVFAIVMSVVGGAFVLSALLNILPILLLWNWIMPELFGLKEITFFQAIGISLLSSLLFKSPNGNHSKNDN